MGINVVVGLRQQEDAAHGTVTGGVSQVRLPALPGQDAVAAGEVLRNG